MGQQRRQFSPEFKADAIGRCDRRAGRSPRLPGSWASAAKSDPGDAKVLADLVRTDRHNHRQVAGGSDLADAARILARAHQSMI
jgi:Transposase